MSTSQRNRKVQTRPASAVDREMHDQYLLAARTPTIQQSSRSLTSLIDDYQALIDAGDLTHALGAGLELVDLGLRIAATPCTTFMDRAHKAGLFGGHFEMMMKAFDHEHVAVIAEAAVATERALSAGPTPSRH